MESLYRVPFTVLECPKLKLTYPAWIRKPSPMFVFYSVLVSYFFVCAGVIYDIINEPPSLGSVNDANGQSRPVAFMQDRVNGQFIMEGIASSFLFMVGGFGFILLDKTNKVTTPRLSRIILLTVAGLCIVVSFFMTRVFMSMKLRGYLK